MTMTNYISINEFENQLSHVLSLIQDGKYFIITDNNKPVAKVTPVNSTKRIAGLNRDELEYISSDFDNSLSDLFLDEK
jgi:prevent-host-death family protein